MPAKRSKKRSKSTNPPTRQALERIADNFVVSLRKKGRPPLLGCLVVLAWERNGTQVQAQSVLLTDQDSIRDILLTTAREHWGNTHETATYPTGHA